MIELSVVVPAFQEQRRLPSSLETILSYLEAGERSFEVVVVDDGSSDETAAAARLFRARGVEVLQHEQNRGKGAALRSGVAVTRGRKVLISDADLSTPIEELARLEPHLESAPLVLGSRAVDDSRVMEHQPVYRELMGKTFNLLLRGLGLVELRDTQCGFKLLEGEVARELFALLTVERFAWDVELVVLARKRAYRVVEVGVEWSHRPDSRVHPLTDSMRMLLDAIRIRLRHGAC